MTVPSGNTTRSNRRRQNLRRLGTVAALVVLSTTIILLFALLVLKIRDPQLSITDPVLENQNFSSNNSSFSMDLKVRFSVQNTNFGDFKFGNGTAVISYLGMAMGEAAIPKARAKGRSSKRFDISLPVNSPKVINGNGSELRSDLRSGVLKMRCTAKLTGKIYLFKVYKKKKSAEMNCTMEIHTNTSTIKILKC